MSNLFVPGEYENTFRFRRNEDSPYRYFHAAARSVYDEGIAVVFICLEDVSQEKEANASALRGLEHLSIRHQRSGFDRLEI